MSIIRFGEPEARITVVGKEVLMDGAHLCDARDERAARIIGMGLHYSGVPGHAVPIEHYREIEEFVG